MTEFGFENSRLTLNDQAMHIPPKVSDSFISEELLFSFSQKQSSDLKNVNEKLKEANNLVTDKNINFSEISIHSADIVLQISKCSDVDNTILKNTGVLALSSGSISKSDTHESIATNKYIKPFLHNSLSLETNQDKVVKAVENHICNICHKGYSSKSSLKSHMSLHTNMKPFICEICYASFAKKCTLTLHSLIHSGERPHKCNICEKRFTRKHDLGKHILIHTGEKPYVCDICNARFNHQNNLKRHKRIHTGEKLHVCNICCKSFSEASLLLTHSKHHIKEAELKNSVNEQLKLIKEKLHVCDICDTSFARKDRLLRHKMTHTAKNVHCCSICNYTFKSKDQLQSHLLIHVDVSLDDIPDSDSILDDLDLTKLEPTVQNINKTFSCELCVKMFSSKKALGIHQMIHTGERPYVCQICQKGFAQSITLKRHKVVHTGERPYTCNLCKKTFTRKTSLRKHITIIHSQKNLC